MSKKGGGVFTAAHTCTGHICEYLPGLRNGMPYHEKGLYMYVIGTGAD